MFAPMFLAMFLTTPPVKKLRLSVEKKFCIFYCCTNCISVVVSVRIQNASHFSFHMFWEILQRMKVKLFIYTITKYIQLKNK